MPAEPAIEVPPPPPAAMPAERTVQFKPRTVLAVLGLLIAVAVVLSLVWLARQALTWVLIALFLALALNPAVEWTQRRGVRRRGLAAAVVYLLALAVIAGLLVAAVPTISHQVSSFVDAVPGYVRDLTRGRGPLGFLETKYHVVERAREAVSGGGGGKLAGGAGIAVGILHGVVTGVVGVVTILVMTFFMLLEGPAWMARAYGLLPAASAPRWRAVAHDVYRTVGGYVSGNLLISLVAGSASALVLLILGVPYALALGLLVGVLDLIPLAGATIAAIVVSLVAFTTSTTAGIVVAIFFVLYQQLENHLLQPLVYGRTVKLSPLAVLISVLIGAEVAGVLGALGAIPVAGTIQVLLVDWHRHRRSQRRPDRSAEDADAIDQQAPAGALPS